MRNASYVSPEPLSTSKPARKICGYRGHSHKEAGEIRGGQSSGRKLQLEGVDADMTPSCWGRINSDWLTFLTQPFKQHPSSFPKSVCRIYSPFSTKFADGWVDSTATGVNISNMQLDLNVRIEDNTALITLEERRSLRENNKYAYQHKGRTVTLLQLMTRLKYQQASFSKYSDSSFCNGKLIYYHFEHNKSKKSYADQVFFPNQDQFSKTIIYLSCQKCST